MEPPLETEGQPPPQASLADPTPTTRRLAGIESQRDQLDWLENQAPLTPKERGLRILALILILALGTAIYFSILLFI